jgi:hypothetical protein
MKRSVKGLSFQQWERRDWLKSEIIHHKAQREGSDEF